MRERETPRRPQHLHQLPCKCMHVCMRFELCNVVTNPQGSVVLQGHLTDVTGICWAHDDSRLVSIGGSHLYHWNAATWQRMPDQEFCDKSLVIQPGPCTAVHMLHNSLPSLVSL